MDENAGSRNTADGKGSAPYGNTRAAGSVPQDRIIKKLDEYMSRRDYEGALRHLKYWLEEALVLGDLRGELVIRNELAGYYRKTGNREEALSHADAAVNLLKQLGFEGSVSSGTTYTNAATAYHAFGEYETAGKLFEKARAAYESGGSVRHDLLGGLYNNMGLTYVAAGRFEEAQTLFEKALEQMRQVPGGELEQAVTCLNMADAAVSEKGPEDAQQRTDELVEEAYRLIETSQAPRDGYYAFVCEKCAPVFSYYGYFIQAEDLTEQAQRIYRQNQQKDSGSSEERL